MTPRITAVLVLYRMRLEDSRCYQSLRHSLREHVGRLQLSLFLYDNSPVADLPPHDSSSEIFESVHYCHDPANGGVAAAYNAALAAARTDGSTWLLLLDQDTELTPQYLHELLNTVMSVPGEVAAIIPRLVQGGANHSPQHLPRLSHRPVQDGVAGLLPNEVTAFNSGAALRVSMLSRFPERYWLDFLDHAIFHQLHAAGGRLWLLQTRLVHQLSTEQLGTDATLRRYQNVLQAERDFYREYGTASDRVYYHLRRVKQALGQLLKVPNKQFALLSLRAALGLLPPTPPREHHGQVVQHKQL